MTGCILCVLNLNVLHAIHRKNNMSAICGACGPSLATFWTFEMGHEESCLSSGDRSHTSLSVVCEDGFVRIGGALLGQRAGWRGELFHFLQLQYTFLIVVRIGCEVKELLFSLVCQVDSIWIIIRSKRPNPTSDPGSGSSRQPSARYSTITFVTAFHISDGWSVCRWAPPTRRHRSSVEAPGDALPGYHRAWMGLLSV